MKLVREESSVQFRPALECEADALTELAIRSKAHWPYSIGQLAEWRDELTVSPSVISDFPSYVVELESRIAGFFVLLPGLSSWELDHFWISPAAMGRGIGRALLEYAVGIASQGGAAAIAIDADPNAESFYVACGARKVGSVAAPIEGLPYRERPQMLLRTHSDL